MKAGQLRQRVEIQRLSASVNAAGQIDETTASNWVTFALRWCSMTTRGSREFDRGPEIGADVTHQIVMRADPISKTFTAKNRLRMGTRYFNIASPPLDVDEGGTMIRFLATEIALDG